MVPTYAFKELSLSAQAKSKKKSHLLRINNTKTRTYQSEGNEATKSTKKKKGPGQLLFYPIKFAGVHLFRLIYR